MIVENALGTWSGERMKQSYTLLDYYGKPWTGKGTGTYTNYGVDQPYGVWRRIRLALLGNRTTADNRERQKGCNTCAIDPHRFLRRSKLVERRI
jgi:hypothetical protein